MLFDKLSNLRHTAALRRRLTASMPQRPEVHVVVAGLSPTLLRDSGKVTARHFFPAFCDFLRRNGCSTSFVTDEKSLKRELDTSTPTATILVYREVAGLPRLEPEVLGLSNVVFNSPEVGAIIREKSRTNEVLTAGGVSMPSMSFKANTPVISNANIDSGAQVTLGVGVNAPSGSYTTEFIDTTVDFRGHSYFTTVRCLCVGRHIVHSYVRARPTTQNDPSVHAKDTPLDPDLIEYLQKSLVEQHACALEEMAVQIADVLGQGFYSHDILVERGSGRVLLCETGYKFDDMSYTRRIAPIFQQLPSHQILLPTESYALRSAAALIKVLRDLTFLQPDRQ